MFLDFKTKRNTISRWYLQKSSYDNSRPVWLWI